MTEHEIEAVRVHVVADTASRPAAPQASRRTVRYLTVTLSAAQPVAAVAGTEPYREALIVRATGNDVYLCESQADALAVAKAGAGGGADAGYLLPHADTAPTPYKSTEQVWAAAIAYPAVLSVMIISREA